MPRDWKEIQGDSKEKYALYLCSREWAEKRREVIERAERDASSSKCCERCMSHAIEVVHHLSYEHKYDERIDELQGLCRACHDFTHAKSDFDPKDYLAIEVVIRREMREFIASKRKASVHDAVEIEWAYLDYTLNNLFPCIPDDRDE